ncbi:cytochrome c551 [Brevibacillus fulvus]|uniref:Cytochrome c551 n=1 Tax=Brevibacillus fulvus TaxID=1125967 RepID=A0A939BTG0_9BACL|nr:cytochrome c [Brevibacillus fulvus]MBM7591468.1 cytochrome c551 [Brevibacillus fulvus]
MKRFPLYLVAGAMVILLSACGQGGQQTQPPANNNNNANAPAGNGNATTPPSTAPAGGGNYDAAQAEALFKNNCSSCHGQNLEGAVGPNLQQVGSRYSKDDILGILQNGKGAMPGGLVSGDDAQTIASWLADKK